MTLPAVGQIEFAESLQDSLAQFMHVHYPKQEDDKEDGKKTDRTKREDEKKKEGIMKDVLRKMRQKWKFEFDPELLISVTGGAKFYTRQPLLDDIIKQGLVDVALSTNAWIVTGGTETGVMKLVGEAIEGYITAPENRKGKRLVALGIAPWGFVAQNDTLAAAERKIVETAKYNYESTTNADKHAPLDPNHTHFLLVDDGDVGESGGEIEFRSRFEKAICFEYRKQKGSNKIPSVLIVVEGGPNTLRTVKESIEQSTPVVVIEGSGRAADLIAMLRTSSNMSADKVRKTAMKVFDLNEDTKKNKELLNKVEQWLKFCLEERKTKLLTVFNPENLEKPDLAKDLINAVLSALLKADKENRQEVLTLAIKWHRWEYAQKSLLTPANKGFWEPELFLLSALEEDQLHFVRYLLDLGIELKDFLNVEKFRILYNSGKHSQEMSDLLEHLPVIQISDEDDYFVVATKGILDQLMKDESFAWEAVEKKGVIKHPFRELFLWAILFNRRQLAQLFWKRGQDHLGGALIACALLRRLAMIADTNETGELSQDLLAHSLEWEIRAYDVLTECYSRDPFLTHRLLVRKLNHWGQPAGRKTVEETSNIHDFEKHHDDGKSGSPTLLNIAQSYELMEFAGHSACQTKLTAIWKGFIAPETQQYLILLCTFLPIFLPLIKFRDERKPNQVSSEDKSRKQKRANCCPLGFVCTLHYFYTAPIVKFFCNIAAYLVYLVIFSYFVLVQLDDGSPTMLEYITWAWLFAMIVEEGREMLFRHQLTLKYRVLKWLSNLWNQLDLSMYLFFFASVVARFLIPEIGYNFKWVRAFYSVALVLSYLRFLHYFYAIKRVGPKVIMIQKMMVDMFLFIAIMVVFVIGFGVAYHANMFPNAPPDFSILVNIVYFPYFQLYGELFLEDFRGEGNADCSTDEAVWRKDPSKRCPEDSRYIMHLMLAVYLVLTNILLVNLLIAMFSYTFQKVQENSLKVWRFYRLSLVHEYFDRPALVPPLIIFNHLYRIFRHFFANPNSAWGKKYNAFRRFYPEKAMLRLSLFERGAVMKQESRSSKGESKSEQTQHQHQQTQTERASHHC